MAKKVDVKKVISLMNSLSAGRVFVSMPVTPLTPKYFLEHQNVKKATKKQGIQRCHGILKLNECALSPFDHGNLYGDGLFEGILIKHGQVYKLKEHLKRLSRSANKLGITRPYSSQQFASHILDTAKAANIKKTDTGYIRLVVTRGIGNLGIDPLKCLAPTVYIIIAKISLYPAKKYKTGIHMSIAKKTRRPSSQVLDPTVKSLNYINNIQAVIEGVTNNPDKSVMEVLELTHKGFVAEASADNIFIVDRSEKQPIIYTPVDGYALNGITRQSILTYAKKLKIKTIKSATLLPEDLLGPKKEVFLTGTAAGIMPVVMFDKMPVGNKRPGPITKKLILIHKKDQKNPRNGLSLNSTKTQLKKYFN